MILNARRNMVFSLSCLGLIAYYCCNFSCFIQNRGRTISLSIIAIVFVGLFVISNIDVLADKVFTRFSERFEVDSRSEVEELFLADLLHHLMKIGYGVADLMVAITKKCMMLILVKLIPIERELKLAI